MSAFAPGSDCGPVAYGEGRVLDSMTASVVIPAHNEETRLSATLASLLSGLDAEVRVVVVCNGCTDATVEVASAFAPRVAVLETPRASKTHALNIAEASLEPGPRAFVDADILISGTSLALLLDATRNDAIPASEPVPLFDTSHSSRLVRAYYAVWLALHGAAPGDIGGGVYCLSERGRGRFGQFPDVMSDDGFVRSHFAPAEIARPSGATSTVHTPHDLRSLVKIKTRSRLGTGELRDRFPELWHGKQSSSKSLVTKMSEVPLTLWPLTPIYITIQLVTRARAWRQVKSGATRWERDDTTRAKP